MKNEIMDTWELTRNAADAAIKKAAKGSGSEILKQLAKKDDPAKKKEREVNQRIIEKVYYACMEEYREGEYTFDEAVEELCKALQAIKTK